MERMGFFTDTSVCVGCRACEVACKEWPACPYGVFDRRPSHGPPRILVAAALTLGFRP